MAIQAPLHVQRRSLKHQRHLIDGSVTRGAANTLIYMNAVIEINVVREPVNLHPMNRFVRAIAFAHRFQVADVIEQHGMAIHARLRRRNARVRGGFHAGVTVTAVNTVIAGVMLVAELNRLVASYVLIGDIWRSGHHQNRCQGNARKYCSAQQTESCEKIRASVKDLCHVRFAPVRSVLRKGVYLGEASTLAEQRGPGSLIDRIVSNNFCGNATTQAKFRETMFTKSLVLNVLFRSNLPYESAHCMETQRRQRRTSFHFANRRCRDDCCASCAINICYVCCSLIQFLLITGSMLFFEGVAASAAAKFTYSGPPGPDATLRWGVVQLVGHLTVNEDGEGSNPSAPAKFFSPANLPRR